MTPVRGWWRRVCLMAAIATGITLLAGSQAFADTTFPINEPFTGATTNNPDWVFTNFAHLTNEGDGWLQLTNADNSVSGSAVLNDAFPSDLGIVVNFQYATWGGQEYAGLRGDGFSFFLMDGSYPPSVGISGGGLGYTYLPGGYMGVGFDEFGNFSGGINGPGQMPGDIAVRGAADNSVAPYTYLTGAPAPGGTVETGSRAGVRSVQISILPSNGHLLLSVLSNTGPGTPLEPVITNFDLQAAGQPALPPTFKLGFAASTGGATNYHEIRDLTVTAPTDLELAKTATGVVNPRHQVTYTLTASNQYVNPVADAVVQDNVPAGITDVTWTCSPGANGGTCVSPSGSGSPVNALVNLPTEGSTAIVTVRGTASDSTAGTTVSNTATVIAPPDRQDINPGNNTASAETEVLPFVDLAVTKTSDTDSVEYGQPISYKVQVTNNGPGSAAHSLVTDPIPAAIDPASVQAPGCTVVGATLRCPLGLLAPGAVRTITITGTVTGSAAACAEGDIVQTATASTSSTDNVEDNNSASVSTPCTVPVNVSIDKTGPASANLGDRIHYRITATNHGSIAAPATAITDTVPTALSNITWSCTVSDGSSCSPSSGTGHTVQTTATIPPGGTAVVYVAGTAAKLGAAVDTATITICHRCLADDRTQAASASTYIRPSLTLAPTGMQVNGLGAAGILFVLTGLGLILPLRRPRPTRRRTTA